jgi:hypothetical protein
MQTPYNNGKIQIGKYYQPPKYVEQDSDMLTIQGWLIGESREAKRNRLANLAYMALLVVSVIVGILV